MYITCWAVWTKKAATKSFSTVCILYVISALSLAHCRANVALFVGKVVSMQLNIYKLTAIISRTEAQNTFFNLVHIILNESVDGVRSIIVWHHE
jgi:hypothetical protein